MSSQTKYLHHRDSSPFCFRVGNISKTLRWISSIKALKRSENMRSKQAIGHFSSQSVHNLLIYWYFGNPESYLPPRWPFGSSPTLTDLRLWNIHPIHQVSLESVHILGKANLYFCHHGDLETFRSSPISSEWHTHPIHKVSSESVHNIMRLSSCINQKKLFRPK